MPFGHGKPRLELRLDDRRYQPSGRRSASYYPWICVRCGATFNAARIARDGHPQAQCDAWVLDVIKNRERYPHMIAHYVRAIALQRLERLEERHSLLALEVELRIRAHLDHLAILELGQAVAQRVAQDHGLLRAELDERESDRAELEIARRNGKARVADARW